MAKILGLDIGGKRTGMAETDVMQMMAFPLKTVPTLELMKHIDQFIQENSPQVIVVGDPDELGTGAAHSTELIAQWVKKIRTKYPSIEVVCVDESFTSQLASEALIAGGMKKKKRQEKGALDKVAASLILERYLQQL